MNKRMLSWVFISIGVVLLACAAWAGYRQYTILTRWPTVDAEVLSSRVIQGHDDEGTAMYSASVQFRYAVDGKEYVTPSSSGVRTSSYPSVKREVDKFAPGTRHAIRYNPVDPNDVTFEAGYNLSFFFLPVLLGFLGIVFSGIGAAVLATSR